MTLLTHNTFWFQGVPFPTDNPPEPDGRILDRLCGLYRSINADVICLQEIQSRQAFDRVADRLSMSGCYCPGILLPQYGGAVFWRPGKGSLVQDARTASLATQRMWQLVNIEHRHGGLRILNIHLPSNRQLGRLGAQAQRIAELRDAITQGDRPPDVIVGDLNERPTGHVTGFLEGQSYIDTAVLMNGVDVSTRLRPGRGDYIWISKPDAGRVIAYQVMEKQALVCGTPGKEYLSDHLPVWITVE